MTHEEKMEEAIRRANLPQGVLDALPSIPALVASLAVAGTALAIDAATGIGGAVELGGAGLLLAGAALAARQLTRSSPEVEKDFPNEPAQATTLKRAAKDGKPFCAKCEALKKHLEAERAAGNS